MKKLCQFILETDPNVVQTLEADTKTNKTEVGEMNVIGSGVELSLKFSVNNLSWWPLVPEGSPDFP